MKFVTVTQFFGCKVSYIISNVQFYQTFDIIVFVKSLRKEVAAAVQVWSRMKVHLYLDVEDFFASNAIRIRIVYQPNTVSTIHMEDMVVVWIDFSNKIIRIPDFQFRGWVTTTTSYANNVKTE